MLPLIRVSKPFNVDYLKVTVEQLISRKDILKDYFTSPLSAYEVVEGKFSHKENQKLIQQIYAIIDRNITNIDLSPALIASELGVSTRQLYRKIENVGLNDKLMNIIKDCRLIIAINMLVKTKLSVDEIIYKSGFSNRATFYKVFVDKYKCTPKEYREKELDKITNK